MKCARCKFIGTIGINLTPVENGRIPGTGMKRYDMLCVECINRPLAIDGLPSERDPGEDDEKGEEQHPF